jgi:hypothetical protein
MRVRSLFRINAVVVHLKNMDETQFLPLRDISESVQEVSEAQYKFVLLSKLTFKVDGQSITMDALLCPQNHEGYVTRLFLERQIPGKGNNWKDYPFLGRTWYACSWKDVIPEQSLIQILLGHLDAFT